MRSHREPRPSWMLDGACRDIDTTVFYPPSISRPDRGPSHKTTVLEARAIAVCNRCPVRQQCLDHALDHDEAWGVWGGTNERQRRAQLRERRIA